MSNAAPYIKALEHIEAIRRNGIVTQLIGLTVRCTGLGAKLGDLCHIYPLDASPPIPAEVVGFAESTTILMPLGELTAVGPGSVVIGTKQPLTVQVGHPLRGCVVDGLGRRLDGMPWKERMRHRSVYAPPPNPLTRPRILTPLAVGIRCIDGLLTIGRGQRLGIFAGSGVGKSTLLGMIAQYAQADLNVIALIGERGREVRDFIERDLGEAGLARSIVVVATSDQPALIRMKGAVVATTIAEYFRDCGCNVLLMMDSVTRYAQAMREVGLAVGEPPATRGYPPSVFAHLPRLLERTGTSAHGSITALYTVLVDGDDMNEPIADTVRGILDGHIVLERKLAHLGHYPAVDVLASVSRLMNELVTPEHRQWARAFKERLATYREAEDLITIGAYKAGTQPKIDRAIATMPKITAFLQQQTDEHVPFAQTLDALRQTIEEE